jgi:PAS domain S-box-containing protein
MASTLHKSHEFHLLLLVGRAADAESVLLELRREGLQFSSRQVCTEADFLAELRDHTPDLIVADYALPPWDGISALKLAQAERPGLPFIFLFDTLGGEDAIGALHHGATDCVAKERLGRLGPVARRALLEVEERRQRQQAEAALRASEQNYRGIFNATRDAIFVHDAATGEILNVNQAMLDLFGYSRADHPNLTVDELFDSTGPYSREEAMRRIRLAVAEGPQVFEWECQRKNGERFWTEVALRSTSIDGKGCVLAVVHDLTARKRAEDALRRNEEYYRALIEQALDVISVIDADGTIRYESPSVEPVLGYRPDELLGRNCFDLVHPEDVARIRAVFAERMGRPFSEGREELRFRHKDGSWRSFEATARNLISDPSVKGMVVNSRDITERKAVEEALRTSEEKFAKVFRNAPVLIAITEFASGTYLEVNEEFRRISGFTREELIGHTAAELGWLSAEDRERFVKRFQTHGRVVDPEMTFRTRGGHRLTGLVKGEPIVIAGRRCLLTIMVDLTARKLSEQQLLEYQHQLQSLAAELSRAEQEERRRLATLLHDDVIQSLALSSIKLGTLRKSLSNAEQRSCVESTRALLEQAIQSTRSLTFQLSPPILHELGLEPALDWLTEQFAGQHGLPCRFGCDAQPKPLTEEVAGVLFAAVRELLVNTVKHARATQAAVSSCREDTTICLRVTDNGVGFDTAAVAGRAGKTGGFGLLNIRERLGYLGGSCDLQSEPGHGTRVVLRAPLKPL